MLSLQLYVQRQVHELEQAAAERAAERRAKLGAARSERTSPATFLAVSRSIYQNEQEERPIRSARRARRLQLSSEQRG